MRDDSPEILFQSFLQEALGERKEAELETLTSTTRLKTSTEKREENGFAAEEKVPKRDRKGTVGQKIKTLTSRPTK